MDDLSLFWDTLFKKRHITILPCYLSFLLLLGYHITCWPFICIWKCYDKIQGYYINNIISNILVKWTTFQASQAYTWPIATNKDTKIQTERVKDRKDWLGSRRVR